MAKNKLHATGAPLGIDGDSTPTTFSFQAGIPIDRADVVGSDNVQVAQSYAGNALKTTHWGHTRPCPRPMPNSALTWPPTVTAPAGGAISWYVDDPTTTPPAALRTEIYWPVK